MSIRFFLSGMKNTNILLNSPLRSGAISFIRSEWFPAALHSFLYGLAKLGMWLISGSNEKGRSPFLVSGLFCSILGHRGSAVREPR
ncbi:hypothetical protein CR161_00775 [Prosthecochloris sp. ZM]|nr:hypothetical protein CR161_00775 [Prosthecochloris sp. ZM]